MLLETPLVLLKHKSGRLLKHILSLQFSREAGLNHVGGVTMLSVMFQHRP